MENAAMIAQISIIMAGATISLAAIGPSLGEGWAAARALTAIAQQPDEASTITRTLFVSMAIIESIAIYCFVISLVLLFANPFWEYFISQAQ